MFYPHSMGSICSRGKSFGSIGTTERNWKKCEPIYNFFLFIYFFVLSHGSVSQKVWDKCLLILEQALCSFLYSFFFNLRVGLVLSARISLLSETKHVSCRSNYIGEERKTLYSNLLLKQPELHC